VRRVAEARPHSYPQPSTAMTPEGGASSRNQWSFCVDRKRRGDRPAEPVSVGEGSWCGWQPRRLSPQADSFASSPGRGLRCLSSVVTSCSDGCFPDPTAWEGNPRARGCQRFEVRAGTAAHIFSPWLHGSDPSAQASLALAWRGAFGRQRGDVPDSQRRHVLLHHRQQSLVLATVLERKRRQHAVDVIF
jgi:hypothetical protein